ncbi:MAG: DUF3658 domain-containing protein [Gammaproteobacteria bacterium]|jgi:hypothetical protein|nr:DUF3658 domain-containing protein [Gammaproteobacteria bacterium]
MSQEAPPFDPDLTEDQAALVAQLSNAQLAEIDQALFSASGKRYRKVAMVVSIAMSELPRKVANIPDVFYSQRVACLVEQGKLEAHGNLKRMRYSEVRRCENI